MPSSFNHFGIIGAGAWGTALALALHRAGRSVSLWVFEPELAASMAKTQENSAYLPGIPLPSALTYVTDIRAMTACDALILATPAQHVRDSCRALAAANLPASTPLIIASKGIELSSHRLMSEVCTEELPQNPVAILSGPSFAFEVARNKPTALTLASENDSEALAQALASPTLRIYTTDDIIGAQIGGALKNVLAIACGIAAGKGLGENARAALITRGLAEITRLGLALGARMETLMGLSGLGDVVLTCSSTQSRNMSLGFALGEGQELSVILSQRKTVTEGIPTAAAALGLARRHGIEMPLVSAVDQILRDKTSVDESIAALMGRALRNETV
ncbi:MAG: NAD(P)-dependent glycerol-3-phosphate dehydrogenase [Alphaproteobacteria bacterium]|nr:NAD(P)-dependent glycerol-3-phosphate dehydrogenase [Alphaproteobacteria bacterium]